MDTYQLGPVVPGPYLLRQPLITVDLTKPRAFLLHTPAAPATAHTEVRAIDTLHGQEIT